MSRDADLVVERIMQTLTNTGKFERGKQAKLFLKKASYEGLGRDWLFLYSEKTSYLTRSIEETGQANAVQLRGAIGYYIDDPNVPLPGNYSIGDFTVDFANKFAVRLVRPKEEEKLKPKLNALASFINKDVDEEKRKLEDLRKKIANIRELEEHSGDVRRYLQLKMEIGRGDLETAENVATNSEKRVAEKIRILEKYISV